MCIICSKGVNDDKYNGNWTILQKNVVEDRHANTIPWNSATLRGGCTKS
jgi:hypothetical protein